MALADIVDKQKDLEPYFGIDCKSNSTEARLLWNIQRYVENAARKFVRHGISQNTYTEFYRGFDIGDNSSYGPSSNSFDLIGNSVYTVGPHQTKGEYLQLNNGFVRSVASVYEDFDARYGQGADDFAAASLLTAGTDYYLELDSAGMSKSGRLIRTNRAWSTRPGTIKVTYTAGLAPSELADEYSFVIPALLKDISEKYNNARSQLNSAFGPVKKEKYVGDYEVEYAVSEKTMTHNALSRETMNMLQPIKAIIL